MRMLRHLFAPSTRRLFPAERLQRITAAVADSEQHHSAEICFAVESGLSIRAVLAGQSARDRAQEVFAQLGVWDTQGNNGVLLYLLLADHRIELVADRGFDGRVAPEQWRGVCELIEEHLKAGEPETAIVRGIEAISVLVAGHFARDPEDEDRDELPNRPHVLD
ncbi:TPM domain-containing protein [Lysobacter sp. A289]